MVFFQTTDSTIDAKNSTLNYVLRDQVNIHVNERDHPIETYTPESEEYEAILLWLLPNNPLDIYRDILSRRRGEGMGSWLLKHPKFRVWLSVADKTLWCPGMAGAGKTMLATIVVEYLLGFYEQAEASVGIACVYINHKEDQTLDKLLLSILKQLIQRRKVISEIVIDAHKTYINDKARPSTEKVLEMLRHEVNSFSDTFVIVDALDECSHGVRVALLKELGRLQPQIHLMVTSRNFEIIADMLKDSVKLDISAQAEDIRAFIKAQIDDPENYRLKDFVRLQPKLQKEIEDEVITTANGMFLLARLHTESLTHQLNPYEVRKALKALPKTLDDTYALALARIERQPLEAHRNFSYKVLSWVAYSFRPLTVNELLYVLAVEPGDLKFNKSKLPLEKDVTGLCAGLVIIDSISGVVRLVHPTMQTYFNTEATRRDLRFSEKLMRMAEICLTCLSFGGSGYYGNSNGLNDHADGVNDVASCVTTPSNPQHGSFEVCQHDSSDGGSDSSKASARSDNEVGAQDSDASLEAGSDDESDADDDLSEAGSDDSPDASSDDSQSMICDPPNVLERYAVCYWGDHARRDSEQSETCSTTLYATAFLCNNARREIFVNHLWYDNLYATRVHVTGLHVAARFGLATVAKVLLENGCDINAKDGEGDSALAIAIKSDHKEVVNVLVNAGAFIDLLEQSGHAAVVNAAEKDYQEGLADRILQRSGWTPQVALLAAVDSGRESELEAIFQHQHLDLKNTHALFGITALLLATERGHYEATRLLLEHGVDVNSAGGTGAASPALHRAAGRGYYKIVKLLVRHGATVDLKDKKGKTAWTYSISKHRKKVSDFLHKAGADPNTKGELGLNELYCAAAGGHLGDVKFLLESGTDPCITTNYGWAPLHWAAAGGYYEIVKLLLKYGAQPSPLSDTGLTPLDQASETEKWDVVKLLEEAGAISGRYSPSPSTGSEDVADIVTLDDGHAHLENDEELRIICYHQTHHLPNRNFVSLLPLITKVTGVTHVIIAAIHLNGPANIHLNNDPPSDPKYADLWTEIYTLQSAGIKVLGMLGGAAAGSFMHLDTFNFESYYSPLKDMITTYNLDGLDLDVEEEMSLNGVIRLIDRLKADFGDDFLITLAPVATALCGGRNISGFDYRSLQIARGNKIAWYNTQFYCGWGNMKNTEDYDAIIRSGWSPSKIVAGMVTNPENGDGWVSREVLEVVLKELKKKYPNFGGVMGWEYYNSLPGDEERPWEWAEFMGKTLKTKE